MDRFDQPEEPFVIGKYLVFLFQFFLFVWREVSFPDFADGVSQYIDFTKTFAFRTYKLCEFVPE